MAATVANSAESLLPDVSLAAPLSLWPSHGGRRPTDMMTRTRGLLSCWHARNGRPRRSRVRTVTWNYMTSPPTLSLRLSCRSASCFGTDQARRVCCGCRSSSTDTAGVAVGSVANAVSLSRARLLLLRRLWCRANRQYGTQTQMLSMEGRVRAAAANAGHALKPRSHVLCRNSSFAATWTARTGSSPK